MLGERRRARACAALLTATSLVVSACATVVQGLPVNASGRPLTVDTPLLDVGNYPTKPRPPLGTAGTPLAGAINDGQRMGNHVVGPWEVDPTLRSTYAMGARVLTSPDELTIIGPAELVAAAGRHNFINGFVSARQAEGRTALMNTVLRFADPPSAAAAAADMGQTVLNQQSSSAPVRPVSTPGHPDALATSYSFIDDDTKRRWIAVRSFTSHGPYVLTQLAESVDGQDAAVTLIANTINVQRPVIDRFEATDTALFADITIDPTGLLARTLPMPPGQATAVQHSRYGKRGALHFQSDPVRSSALFDQTVMDLAAMAKTNVYRTADADAAIQIVDAFASEVETVGGKPIDGVKHMPASRCLQLEDGVYCVAPAGRYAIEAQSRQATDARQQAAAQYVLLVAE